MNKSSSEMKESSILISLITKKVTIVKKAPSGERNHSNRRNPLQYGINSVLIF